MLARPFAVMLALTVCALGTTTAPSADACGPVTVEDRVEMLVQGHFAALNAHDRERLLTMWSDSAIVVSEGEPTLVEPIDRAATRWVTAKRPVTFEIARIEQPGDHTAIARVNVVFDGKKVSDTILFKELGNGWKMAGKSSRVVGAASNVPAVRY